MVSKMNHEYWKKITQFIERETTQIRSVCHEVFQLWAQLSSKLVWENGL